MQGQLPPEAQEKIEELRDAQETLQQLEAQRQESEVELEEARNALDVLEEVDEDTTMYHETGGLFIETEYDDAESALTEQADELEARIESIERKQEKLEERMETLQEELQEMLGGPMGGA